MKQTRKAAYYNPEIVSSPTYSAFEPYKFCPLLLLPALMCRSDGWNSETWHNFFLNLNRLSIHNQSFFEDDLSSELKQTFMVASTAAGDVWTFLAGGLSASASIEASSVSLTNSVDLPRDQWDRDKSLRSEDKLFQRNRALASRWLVFSPEEVQVRLLILVNFLLDFDMHLH
ncbi:unnamed protein product [Protopolystoma xenopodis]|uniref:Uncharacterized protein n=1 Tax=Protopolystoma xenopodis TaxID=117903 RepID=A0A3S5BCU5_9PLAT|nr:unnamed protein product [Protopolystoma xenopodis]